MSDSTARAERIDLTSETAFYTWEAPQKPLVVHLPMTLIDRLESEAVENFRSLSSRGSEIGGLLLGSIAPGSPAAATVDDYELIPCDYSRGPLYRLSDADLGRFEQAIEKHSAGTGPRVIGYFRSHTRKGLSLDAEDLSFFEPRFLEPQHLVLLIRPFATKASTAGIFIRENGRIHGDSSYLEFPFRSSELGAAKVGASKPETTNSAAPAPSTAASKAAPRAQIVPIASRREIAMPEPSAPQATAVPIVSERVEPPPAAPQKGAPAVLALETKTPEPAEKTQKETKAIETAPEKELETLAPVFETVEAAPKSKKLKLMVAAAICMLVLVGGSLVVYPLVRKSLTPKVPVAQQDSSPLSLRVERTSGGMLLSWNRDLPAIQNATKVVLSITDGERHENIQLDPNQVRTGSILYPPITGDVSFQMEVISPKQATTSESLRVLDPRPSPLVDPSDAAKTAAGAKTAAATPAVAETTAPSTDTAKPAEEAPVTPKTPLKAFDAQSLAQRLRPVTATDLPEGPALVQPSGSSSANLPGMIANQAPAPAPAPPVRQAAPPASTAASEVGGQLIPAQIISRVDPEYPRIARQAGANGLVELEATIDIDGHVKNPHVLRGNAMLQRAAIEAVLKWRYQPAQLNGKKVESPIQIRLNFVANR